MKTKKLLTEKEYSLIQKLNISHKKKFSGLISGEQRSHSKGVGIEFTDYKTYQPGDDVRQIDWGIFLRLRKLLIKQSSEEKELTIMFMIDSSRSMTYGEPEKLLLAKKISAILSGIALKEGNKIIISIMKEKLEELLFYGRTHNSFIDVIQILEEIKPVEKMNPAACLKEFFSKYKNKCMLVLISDLLFEEWENVFNIAGLNRAETYIIQLLSKEELDPDFFGELTLVDIENLNEVSLNLNNSVKEKYKNELDLFLSKIKNKSKEKRINTLTISSETKVEKIFNNYLKKSELLC